MPAKLIEDRARSLARLVGREPDLVLDLVNIPLAISEEYLARIVEELVQNAFKFSSTGSGVRVALTNSSPHAAFSVTDRGRGFATEHLTKIGAYMQFDRKIQEQQGLGLGLIIAKRLTELHGGTLTIQREQPEGTTVIVKLPTAQDLRNGLPAVNNQTPTPELQKLEI